MTRPVEVGVDASGLNQLAKDLRKLDRAMTRRLRTKLRAGGQLVADEAKGRASWSSRIPSTIKVRTSGGRVKVIAGGDGAPHAAAYESLRPTFRHPVFGNRQAWVEQQSRPFLLPSLQNNVDRIAELVADAVADLGGL